MTHRLSRPGRTESAIGTSPMSATLRPANQITMIEVMAKVIEGMDPYVDHSGAPSKIEGVYALSLARDILQHMAEHPLWRRMAHLALADPADVEAWEAAAARCGQNPTPITEAMRPAVTEVWGADIADQIIPKKPN